MLQYFALLDANPTLKKQEGFYQDENEPYRDSTLSHELQELVETIFAESESKSLFSLDLSDVNSLNKNALNGVSQSLQNICSSSSCFRFLEGFDFSSINTVLDISEDFGGVAHFIADHVSTLESVKRDPLLAQLANTRCANKHNVAHISADIEKLSFKESSYDLIFISQLEALKLKDRELNTLLIKLKSALSPTGCIVINALNSERLSKWLNTGSTHTLNGLPHNDLYEHTYDNNIVVDLKRKALRDRILNSNFSAVDIYAAFANGNQHKAIFSEDYLTSSVNAINHFYQLSSIDNPDINEYLLFKRLIKDQHNLVDFAQNHIVIAGSSTENTRQLFNEDFRHYPNIHTPGCLQTTRSRIRANNFVTAQSVTKSDSEKISNPSDQRPFHNGELLVSDWLEAIRINDHRHFEQLIQEYSDWLTSTEFRELNNDGLFDVLPSQIIVQKTKGTRTFHLIGDSRRLKTTPDLVTQEFLLFRALVCFAFENNTIIKHFALANDIVNLELFIVEYMPSVHDIDQLKVHIGLAEEIEKELNSSSLVIPLSQRLAETFDQTTKLLNHKNDDIESLTEIQQKNRALVGQANQLKAIRLDNEQQALRILDLIEHRSDIVDKMNLQSQELAIREDKLRAEIDNLHDRLHAQNQRNDELHGYLLMRPTTRAKRVARRTISRLSGQPIIDHDEAAPEPIEEVPTPILPKGERIGQNVEDYQLWISENTLTESDIEAAKVNIESMAHKPLFSILVPIYNTDPEYLLPMIESVRNQIYPHWQLCLVDDCSPKSYLKRILEHEALQDSRISIQLNDVNQGISVTTNDALALAKGDYIALLDHDDEISIDALYENAKVINSTPEAGLIYSDEDKLTMEGKRIEAYFKPDYSPDLLHANNYICHFTVIKTEIAKEIGGFREGLDGSQDHDIILRAAAAADKVVHIPKILYHWRKIPGSTAVSYDSKSYAWEAGRRAVEDQLKKEENGVRVEFGTLKGTYRVHREIKGEPLISIIIPFKDKPGLLQSCLDSILNRSSYQNFEIIGVSNNSEAQHTFNLMSEFAKKDSRIRFVERNIPFNFSAICNYGVQQADGEYIVLLNNDIEIITPDWLELMLEHAQGDSTGAVGGKLLFADGTIQHAGVVAGMVGAAGHPHKFFPDNHIGYHGRLHMVNNVSAVTGAMLMVNTQKFLEVGGLDEDNLAVAYNDIDFCLKLIDKGYMNVFTPHCKATHHESISRGYEDTDEKMQRLLKEQRYFLDTWSSFLEKGDPFYNPNLSLKNERFSLNFKD